MCGTGHVMITATLCFLSLWVEMALSPYLLQYV
jgi:hypothetical protein